VTAGEGGFEFVDDVTSDVTFVARGETLSSVFAAAAAALLAATVDNPEDVRDRTRRRVELEEPDLELLMLRWLSELVYLRDARELLLRAERVEVALDGGAHLAAELAGETLDPARHRAAGEVKAATAHGLEVARTATGWMARVTLDV
jgi:SHS2 domain-containing protein